MDPIVAVIEGTAKKIIDNWDDWQAEAGQQSQIEQDPRAGELIMEGHLYHELSKLIGKINGA